MQAPVKFVPQSDLNYLAGSLMAKKHPKALMQLEESIEAITLMWTALELIQQNDMAHRLLSDCTPLVHLVVMCHGLKTSSPTYMKGGQALRRPGGRSAICCSCMRPLHRCQDTHLWRDELMSLLPPRIQGPAAFTASSLRWGP